MNISDFLSSGAKLLDTQTFDASGTWNKAAAGVLTGTEVVEVMLIGGGGGGGRGAAVSAQASGGGGGGCVIFYLPLWLVPATAPVVIGAGGIGALTTGPVASTSGGGTSFMGFYASGGQAGANGTSGAVTVTYNPVYPDVWKTNLAYYSEPSRPGNGDTSPPDVNSTAQNKPTALSAGAGGSGSSTGSVKTGGVAANPNAGNGGDGAATGGVAATPGSAGGGGGGGGTTVTQPQTNGADGGAGRAIIKVYRR